MAAGGEGSERWQQEGRGANGGSAADQAHQHTGWDTDAGGGLLSRRHPREVVDKGALCGPRGLGDIHAAQRVGGASLGEEEERVVSHDVHHVACRWPHSE